MPEERSSGEVKQLEPGKFFVRAFLGYDEAYKRIYKSKTVYGTKRDANRVLRELIRLRDDNKVTRSIDTLNEYFELWLEKIMKHKVAKRTYRDYRGSFERYIKKSIGGTELRKLKHRHVADLYDYLFTRGLSRRTVVSCHTVLNMALNYAVKTGKLAKNPAQGYEFPKKRRKPVEAYTLPEARAFLEAAQSDPYFAFFA